MPEKPPCDAPSKKSPQLGSATDLDKSQNAAQQGLLWPSLRSERHPTCGLVDQIVHLSVGRNRRSVLAGFQVYQGKLCPMLISAESSGQEPQFRVFEGDRTHSPPKHGPSLLKQGQAREPDKPESLNVAAAEETNLVR